MCHRLLSTSSTSADLTTVLKSNALEYTANGELAVLIVDNFTLRVLTSCLNMDDILAAGYAGTQLALISLRSFSAWSDLRLYTLL